ncbi:hypothetical protein HYC85_028714 [Camellia sinensis]|uniref:Protein kinase domain-containing protein n=1 Tax=Camellia sinensis TaxID=4442 RepID=A0A7J7FVY2_CAMSI|nr:hypothetical protein HYC85_028714 [Camellia sinensis]
MIFHTSSSGRFKQILRKVETQILITGQSCPLSFKGSPYWMAPEVIKNPTGCNLAVDIWSLGCTVLEMATGKPPWSQYEGVAALFKIGNSKELPAIPENLSDEGKDFVRLCLQRNPLHRPTAAKLLEHPFVNNAATFERPILDSEPPEPSPTVTNALRSLEGFKFTNEPYAIESILNLMHDRYKSYRHDLRQRFRRFPTMESALADPPENMEKETWKFLCEKWSDKDYKVRCGKNKLNREKLKVLHTAGSKAFRKVQYDERDRATGEELGLVELYKKTHFSEKKEAWVHADAEIRHSLKAIYRRPNSLFAQGSYFSLFAQANFLVLEQTLRTSSTFVGLQNYWEYGIPCSSGVSYARAVLARAVILVLEWSLELSVLMICLAFAKAVGWEDLEPRASSAAAAGPSFLKRKFFRSNSNEFFGDPKEPLQADEWLEQMMKTFEILGIEDNGLRIELSPIESEGGGYPEDDIPYTNDDDDGGGVGYTCKDEYDQRHPTGLASRRHTDGEVNHLIDRMKGWPTFNPPYNYLLGSFCCKLLFTRLLA